MWTKKYTATTQHYSIRLGVCLCLCVYVYRFAYVTACVCVCEFFLARLMCIFCECVCVCDGTTPPQPPPVTIATQMRCKRYFIHRRQRARTRIPCVLAITLHATRNVNWPKRTRAHTRTSSCTWPADSAVRWWWWVIWLPHILSLTTKTAIRNCACFSHTHKKMHQHWDRGVVAHFGDLCGLARPFTAWLNVMCVCAKDQQKSQSFAGYYWAADILG